MIPLPLRSVARLVGAPGSPAGDVTGEVHVDSRLVGAGDLFVALPGERSDGHDHVQSAFASGAVAALVGREVAGGGVQLVVPDPLTALQDLAATVYGQAQPLTVGVTGSSGKTSTKDLLGQVLSAFGDTLFPEGSFNNELGLPLTALRRTASTRFAALEYSARGVGHIAFLCGIAQPDVAVVLNVGSAHLGEFGSVQAIAQAKGELVEAARERAVLNADDRLVLGMRTRTERPVTTFGSGADADVRVEGLELDGDGRASFRLVAPHLDGMPRSADVALTVVGEHQAANAAAVAAAVLGSVTDDVEAVAELLSGAEPLSRWRMEVRERADGVTVVNDAYNANPDSMRAALKTLAVMSRGKTRRTWAVLGPMAELGDGAREAHMDLGRFLVRLDPTGLVVVGEEAGGIYAGAVLEGSWGGESVHVDDADQALALLRAQVQPGDVVLVKASRSAGLERLAAALLEQAP